MSNEYYVGIDFSLEKLTVVISDSAKRPVSALQILQSTYQKNKVKYYVLESKQYRINGQFETFSLEEIGCNKRPMSIGKIHFQNRLIIQADELRMFLSGFPKEEFQKFTMEGYSRHSMSDAFYTGEGNGSLKTLMYLFMGIELDFFPPPTKPKKYVLGSGDLGKEAIMYLVEREHGYKFPNDDLADAYMLSIYPFFAPKEDQIIKIPT